MSAINRAIEAVGSQKEMAAALGITQQAVSEWVVEGRVPLKRIKEVSALSGVAVGDLLMDVAKTNGLDVVPTE